MKWFRNILLLYLCFHLFGGNLVSYVFKFQDSVTSMNMAEEEDDASAEGKENADSKESSKEEKLHCAGLELSAAVIYLEKLNQLHRSDGKMINYSFEIASPPPNC